MNDIDKTNADECLNELFEEQPKDDKHCDDSCAKECECNRSEECNCAEDCTCDKDCACEKECKCDKECDCHENVDETEQDDTNCDEKEVEQDKQPSDNTFEALLRLQAEFDNYRKRTEKEKSEIYHHGFVDAVTDFLPALDSFKMAKEYITDKNTLVGIEYIEKGILQTLEKMGVSTIDATGKFDPNFHTAIDTSNDENYEEGDIVKECYKGFKMGDKVIRFSQVIVKR